MDSPRFKKNDVIYWAGKPHCKHYYELEILEVTTTDYIYKNNDKKDSVPFKMLDGGINADGVYFYNYSLKEKIDDNSTTNTPPNEETNWGPDQGTPNCDVPENNGNQLGGKKPRRSKRSSNSTSLDESPPNRRRKTQKKSNNDTTK